MRLPLSSGVISMKKIRNNNLFKIISFLTMVLFCSSCGNENYKSKTISPQLFIKKYPKFLEVSSNPDMMWKFFSDGTFNAISMTSTYGFTIEGSWESSKNGQITISGTTYNTRTKVKKSISDKLKNITIWNHPPNSEPQVKIKHETELSVF